MTTEDNVADCVDFAGRRVVLDQVAAEHILERHPEIACFRDQVCTVLAEPDYVYSRSRTNSFLFYRAGVLGGRLSDTYAVVIVRYNEHGEGEVRTMYPTTQPARGDVLVHVRRRRR